MKQIQFYIFFLLLVSSFFKIAAQQLSYEPKNPAFGGDTFNYQWLLNSANAQNSISDPNETQREERTELERFTESLNRQLIGQVSRSLLSNQIGDEGLRPGKFSFGDFEVEVFDSDEGLVVEILDINTGEQTQVIVPN